MGDGRSHRADRPDPARCHPAVRDERPALRPEPRLLAIDLTGGTARYSVLADGHLRLGDADRGGPFGGSRKAREQVDDLVVRLVAGTADSDIAPPAGPVGHRLHLGHRGRRGHPVPDRQHPRAGHCERYRARHGLAAEPRRVPAHPDGGRRRISPSGARPPVGASRPGRSAAPRSARRRTRAGQATPDDQPLAPVTDGWQQAFAVPADARPGRRWSIPVSHRVAVAGPGSGAAGGGSAGCPRRTPSRGPRSDQVGPAGCHAVGAGVMADLRDGRRSRPTRRRDPHVAAGRGRATG